MGFAKRELEERQMKQAAWQFAQQLEFCSNCRHYSLDPAERWCRTCFMRESDAWAALIADPNR